MRILVVDDDPIIIKLLQGLLRDLGECEAAENGRLGYHLFCKAIKDGEPYGLVCLDLFMPSMNGLQALKGMREAERLAGVEEEKRCRIVVVTNQDDPAIRSNIDAAGADAYISKLSVKSDLITTLEGFGLIT